MATPKLRKMGWTTSVLQVRPGRSEDGRTLKRSGGDLEDVALVSSLKLWPSTSAELCGVAGEGLL